VELLRTRHSWPQKEEALAPPSNASAGDKRAVRHAAGMRHVDLSNVQVASSETARRINRDIVLELIRTSQPISRADLARRSGLQRSTVSQIVEQLIGENWIREGPVASAPRGRRPTMLGLNEDLVAVAVDIHPRQATVAVVDLNGRVLMRAVAPLTSNAAASTRAIAGSMQRMLRDLPGKSAEGIGISLPGRVDPSTQRMIFAPNLRWPDFDLKKTIERKTGLPVKLENAATAALLAELTFARMDGVRDAVLVTISEGVGTSVFANGQVVAGHHGVAGEFGHVPIDPAGPRCACGQKGCWETFASSRAALRFYREMEPEARAATFQELISLAEMGDHAAARALEQQAMWIGRGLRILIAGISPSTILIAGEITPVWHRYAPIIEKEVAALTLAGVPPKVRPVREGDAARLRGAAALVFQQQSTCPTETPQASRRRTRGPRQMD